MSRMPHNIIICFAFLFQVPARYASAQTASEIIARIETQSGVQVQPNTADTFKAGDPSTRITGIAVTMMATLDVIQRAAAKGHNLIITHEPVFYSHRDATDVLEREKDPVLLAKQAVMRRHGIVVWRFHDRPHAMRPDMIGLGMARAMGWLKYQDSTEARLFTVPATTLGTLAKSLEKSLNARTIRIVGDPNARVSRVAVTPGFSGFSTNRRLLQLEGVEALVMGEDFEWETIEYAVDAVTAGLIKGLIVLGHVPSEQAGMEEVTRWLKTFITSVPVEFVPTREPFTVAR